MPDESYVRKSYKQIPNDSYFYLARQLENFIMSNLRGLAETQNISNPQGVSMDKSKSKRVNIYEIK